MGQSADSNPWPPSVAGVRLVSNARDEIPQQTLLEGMRRYEGSVPDIEFLATHHYQDSIATLLQQDYDVVAWFSGCRNRQFGRDGLVLDVREVLDSVPSVMPAARAACTADDGRQFLIPVSFYSWAVNYSKPVFDKNGWAPPTTFDELLGLADDMAAAGIVPFAMANDGTWPAMGTFDMLNMRVNGYQFHRELLAGAASFTDGRVKDAFRAWEQLLPYQQPNANQRVWQQAATDLAEGTAGMHLLGTFAASADDRLVEDMDFFNYPVIDPAVGAGAIIAPIDGYMLSARSSAPDQARQLLAFLASGAYQQSAMTADSTTVHTNLDAPPPAADRIKRRSFELASAADEMAGFLDRDTNAQFAPLVGQVLAEFLDDPSSIDAGLARLEQLSEVLL